MRLFRSIAVSLALLAAGFNAFAQNRELTGVVLDATDFPLIGVAVIVDGTTNGVMTAEDGSFALTVPAAEVVLNVSSLGYETKLVTVPATQDKITIYLSEDNMLIEETVVVGYGTQKKVNLTGAVGVVDSKQLEDRTAHNLSTMLQGSMPGLNISTSSGNPGSSGTLAPLVQLEPFLVGFSVVLLFTFKVIYDVFDTFSGKCVKSLYSAEEVSNESPEEETSSTS